MQDFNIQLFNHNGYSNTVHLFYEFKFERIGLRQPASPILSPDYHFFRQLGSFLQEKCLITTPNAL